MVNNTTIARQNPQLKKLRIRIDSVDQAILTALAKRMNLVRAVGKHKRTLSVPPLDAKRWDEILRTRVRAGKSMRLSPSFVKALLTLIHREGLTLQQKKKA